MAAGCGDRSYLMMVSTVVVSAAGCAGDRPCPSQPRRPGAPNPAGRLIEDRERIHTLETAQATQTAAVAGMQTAQAVAHSGTWAVMGAGGVSLVVGIFLGMAIAKH